MLRLRFATSRSISRAATAAHDAMLSPVPAGAVLPRPTHCHRMNGHTSRHGLGRGAMPHDTRAWMTLRQQIGDRRVLDWTISAPALVCSQRAYHVVVLHRESLPMQSRFVLRLASSSAPVTFLKYASQSTLEYPCMLRRVPWSTPVHNSTYDAFPRAPSHVRHFHTHTPPATRAGAVVAHAWSGRTDLNVAIFTHPTLCQFDTLMLLSPAARLWRAPAVDFARAFAEASNQARFTPRRPLLCSAATTCVRTCARVRARRWPWPQRCGRCRRICSPLSTRLACTAAVEAAQTVLLP